MPKNEKKKASKKPLSSLRRASIVSYDKSMKENSFNHYQLLPDGSLFVVPVQRSIMEVLYERTKVAKWFQPDEDRAKVLGGSCPIFLSSLSMKKGSMIYDEPCDLEVNLRLQDMIDVYNDVTAQQVIELYKRSRHEAP